MIDSHLKRERKPKGIGRYYPSEIGSCLRKVYYSYKFPQEVEPDLLKIFEMGNIIHDFVVEVLNSEKNPDIKLLKTEFPFREQIDDFTISGRVDDLLLIRSSGKNLLVEVKSTKNISYIDQAQPQHIAQLQLYMHFTNVHDGVLLYVDKTNLNSEVFTVPYSRDAALKIIDRFKKLHNCLKKGELPVAEAKQIKEMEWMCRYCEYKERCERAS